MGVDSVLGLLLSIATLAYLVMAMTADVDYEVIRQSLPAGVVPAYDGLRLETR